MFVIMEICVSELHGNALDGVADSIRRSGCGVVVLVGITMVSASVGSKRAGVRSKLLGGGGECC